MSRFKWLKNEGINIRMLCFFAYASGATWYPVFNIYLQQKGLSGTEIGIIGAIIPAMMLMSQTFWGMFADRWGRRKTLLLTMLATSVLGLGFLIKGGFSFYFLWMIPFALFYNPFGPLIDSLSLDYIADKPKLSYGKMRLWGSVGWAIFTLAVGYVIADGSYAPIFPIATGLMFLGVLIGWNVPAKPGSSGLEVNLTNLKPLLKNWKLLFYLLVMLLMAIGTFPIWTFYSIFLNDLGASSTLIGFAFSLDAAMEIPFYFVAAFFLRRFGAGRLLLISIFSFALRLFLYSIARTAQLAVAVELLQGFTWALFLVGAVEYVNEIMPAAWRATGQSLFWAVHFGAGAIIGNSLAGYLYDHMSLHLIFRYMACLMLVTAVIGLFVFGRRKKESSIITADLEYSN